MSEPILELRKYPGLSTHDHTDSVSLANGELLFLRGASGAGKSRLLRRIIQLDPEDAGQISFRSRAVSSIPVCELRTRIGYLPQDPVALTITGTEFLLRIRSFKANQGRSAPEAELTSMCDSFELAAVLDRPMNTLSGGEKRRLALVAVLSIGPELLLLDEPTNGLDKARISSVTKIIKACLARGAAVIWACHDSGPDGFESYPVIRVTRES